jgi:hypothetical protein
MKTAKQYQFTERAGIWPESRPWHGGLVSYSTKKTTKFNRKFPKAQVVGIITLNSKE